MKKIMRLLIISVITIPLLISCSISNEEPNETSQPQDDPVVDNPSDQQEDKPDEQNSDQQDDPNRDTQNEYLWGIDTASLITTNFYNCVVESYGKSAFAGRYTETKEDVSYGLRQDEINLLQEKGVKIALIYNMFTDATGYEKGVQEAEQAINDAEELGAPAGVAIFADIEPIYPADSDFIRGWIETIRNSNYIPGIYGVFDEGQAVVSAYNSAIQELQVSQNDILVWDSEAVENVTTKENAPKFNPDAPGDIEVDIWQYGISGDQCNIDTNLIKEEALDDLW